MVSEKKQFEQKINLLKEENIRNMAIKHPDPEYHKIYTDLLDEKQQRLDFLEDQVVSLEHEKTKSISDLKQCLQEKKSISDRLALGQQTLTDLKNDNTKLQTEQQQKDQQVRDISAKLQGIESRLSMFQFLSGGLAIGYIPTYYFLKK